MLNFNPYFKPPDEDGVPFVSKTYASDVVNVLYPEDILASEIEKSSDVSVYKIGGYCITKEMVLVTITIKTNP